MTIKTGDKLPNVDLFEGTPQNKVNLAEIVKGKKVVIFGEVGAFTPCCSKAHLPGFVSEYENFKSKGIDEVICIAVNDPYVLQAWGDQVKATGKIRMLSDTQAKFCKAVGLELDMTVDLGNIRCKRFSLYAVDGVIKALNVEPDGDGNTCSKAQTILEQCC